VTKQEQNELNKQLRTKAMYGNATEIIEMLDAGADVNACDTYGNTSLIIAAAYGQTKIVQSLLNRGADVNIQDEGGWTALMHAAWNGHTETVNMLLDRGADPNIQNIFYSTVLSHASWCGRTEIVKLLLEHGAERDLADKEGSSPLIMACQDPINKRKVITLLLAANANTDVVNHYGMTALMYLARNGYTGLMKLLIKDGADMNIKDAQGRTALDILWEFHPEKYDKWIKRATIKAKKKTLKREDSVQNRGGEPDFEI